MTNAESIQALMREICVLIEGTLGPMENANLILLRSNWRWSW